MGDINTHSPTGDIGSGFGPSGGEGAGSLTVHSPADNLTGSDFSGSPTSAEFGPGVDLPGSRASTGPIEMVQLVTGVQTSPSGSLGSNMAEGLAKSPNG